MQAGLLSVENPPRASLVMWAAVHGAAEVLLMGLGFDHEATEELVTSVIDTVPRRPGRAAALASEGCSVRDMLSVVMAGSRRRGDRWRSTAIYLAIAGAVAGIGARRLSADPSMWRDEAWTWLAIDRHLAGVLDVVVSDEANMGPYYVGLRIWSTLGSSDAWLRGFSVLGGVLAAVTLFAFIAEVLRSPSRSARGVVLLVTNPVFVTPPHPRLALTRGRCSSPSSQRSRSCALRVGR